MNYELRSYIGISRLKNEIDAKSNKLVKEYGLSLPQFAVMEALYHKKDMSVGQVREKILSSSGTMPVIIRNLKKKSYLISYKDKDDKRREILSLTNEGKKLIEEIFPKNKKIIEKSFENLSRDEIKDFVKILKKLEV
ncbi:MarR family winged helix-turn-helix transcriptional regulator [Anaerococcus hydrogenalis]|uniref:MarR family winged helix-turn-helix transcriptional regulator n=1 Tax=Anaerococcus hydrogenalis TaxID=33029 RepID=UPI001DEC68A5|nr:MarR family winged helix-turn-helix transcriptional regulator [Anaerococcus hydrogenalis]MBS5988585.1 winged helix-turn-helix transcriptional regulator [Anaerococcus hydrogenalis]